jgi:hypothetical protein
LELPLRNYQVTINVPIPVTMSVANELEDSEAMFRFLNDLMTDVSIEVHAQTKAHFQSMQEQAGKAGFQLKVPDFACPMGVGYSISDVTGQVGRKWSEKK